MTNPQDYAKSIHKLDTAGIPILGGKRMKFPIRPTPERPMYVSTSELGSFLRCRLQWHWGSRLGMRRKGMKAEQGIGILVHNAREQWYVLPPRKRTVDAMERIAKKQVFKHGAEIQDSKNLSADKARALVRAMSIGYAEWALGDHDVSDEAIGLHSAKDIQTEQMFTFPLVKDGSIIFRGKMDLRYTPTIFKKTMVVEEAKTRGGISFEMMDLSDQLSAYVAGMMHHYPKMKRYIAWRTVLRRQMPGPRVTAPLFGRESIERGPDEIHVWLTDVRRKVTDMLDAAIYPTQTDSCKWDCDLYNLCVMRSTGSDTNDVAEVAQSEFERR